MFGRSITDGVPIGSRGPSQHATSPVHGVGCISIRSLVVRFWTGRKFGSETDIAVAGHNALFYGFSDVQRVVEMTPNHIHLSNHSEHQVMGLQHAYKPSRMDLALELPMSPSRRC